jgi:peptide/nickel transport system ATP-binding protein
VRASASRPELVGDNQVMLGVDGGLGLLHRLRRDLGLAYLFISHDIEVVRPMCQSIIIMQHGILVEQGPIEEVLTCPRTDYGKALLSAVPRLPVRARRHP